MGNIRSFSSVSSVIQVPTPAKSIVPIAIAYPIVLDSIHGGPFKILTTENAEKVFISNFRNLLLTNHGELIGAPFDCGANLRSLLSERIAIENFDDQAIELIKTLVEKYSPNISLISFESNILESTEKSISSIRISINFIVKGFTNKRQIDLTLNNMG